MSGLGDRIYERARLTGEFRLRSGVTNSEYFDKYLFESDPRLLREIAEELAGGRENLAAEGLDLRTLFTMSQLRENRVTDPARP
ncbi:MAG: hypothetical protein ACHQE6_06445 [Solirubrobacterales bacterium]